MLNFIEVFDVMHVEPTRVPNLGRGMYRSTATPESLTAISEASQTSQLRPQISCCRASW
jgi:hypothetical protein